MAELLIQPSAGMMFPEPSTLPLAGRRFLVGELKVREVGAIENAFASRLSHPMRGMEGAAYVIRNRHEFSRDEIREAGLGLLAANVAWPPRMGSGLFHRTLCTPAGAAIFLYVVLSRLRPRLDPARVSVLMSGACEGELGAIAHAAWGHPAWERVESGRGKSDEDDARDDDEASSGGPDRGGMRWGKYLSYLARNCGWTYAEMGEMTLGQFMNELDRGGDRVADLEDITPVDPRSSRISRVDAEPEV